MDVKHVAKLANLPITSDQEEKLTVAFSQTLETVDQINKLDTSGVEPVSQVTGLKNVTRSDEVDQTRVLNIGHYFKIKAIFGEE